MRSDIEKEILYYTTYMWTLQKRNQIHLETADWWLPEVGVRVGKMSKGDQKIQTSSYKINMSWECNIYHGDYSSQFSSIYLKVSKGVNLKIIFFLVMRIFNSLGKEKKEKQWDTFE